MPPSTNFVNDGIFAGAELVSARKARPRYAVVSGVEVFLPAGLSRFLRPDAVYREAAEVLVRRSEKLS